MRTILLASLLILQACSPEGQDNKDQYRQGTVVEAFRQPSPEEASQPTRVVVLGTGTPHPDPNRAGPSIAVIHKGYAYIFDLGAGSVRNAVKARHQLNIPALYPVRISGVFLTHLHSDHFVDLPELASTLWWRRDSKLELFGPVGSIAMTEGIYKMMSLDISIRTSGDQPIKNPDFYQLNVTEIEPGIVFEKDDLTIEAFPVPHGEIRPAFGFKIVTNDKSIVISGDTSPSDLLIEKAAGVDLLFHEVISDEGLAKLPKFWQIYHKNSHTTGFQVGEIAAKAMPKELILYHALFYGASERSVVDAARASFKGKVTLADDLDEF